jgi:hypothetical protein
VLAAEAGAGPLVVAVPRLVTVAADGLLVVAVDVPLVVLVADGAKMPDASREGEERGGQVRGETLLFPVTSRFAIRCFRSALL